MLKLSASWDIFSTRKEVEEDLTMYLVHPEWMSDTLDDALQRLAEFLGSVDIPYDRFEDIGELLEWFSDPNFHKVVLEYYDEV